MSAWTYRFQVDSSAFGFELASAAIEGPRWLAQIFPDPPAFASRDSYSSPL